MPNAVARRLSAHASPYPEILAWPSSNISNSWPWLCPPYPVVALLALPFPSMLQDNLGEFPTGRMGLGGILAEENKMPAPSLFGWHQGPVQSRSLKGCHKVVITEKVQLVSLWNTEGWCSGNGYEHQCFWCLQSLHLLIWKPGHLAATRPHSWLYKMPAGCSERQLSFLSLPQIVRCYLALVMVSFISSLPSKNKQPGPTGVAVLLGQWSGPGFSICPWKPIPAPLRSTGRLGCGTKCPQPTMKELRKSKEMGWNWCGHKSYKFQSLYPCI